MSLCEFVPQNRKSFVVSAIEILCLLNIEVKITSANLRWLATLQTKWSVCWLRRRIWSRKHCNGEEPFVCRSIVCTRKLTHAKNKVITGKERKTDKEVATIAVWFPKIVISVAGSSHLTVIDVGSAERKESMVHVSSTTVIFIAGSSRNVSQWAGLFPPANQTDNDINMKHLNRPRAVLLQF